MEFIKVTLCKVDLNGNPVKSNMGSSFESLVSMSLVDAIIKPKAGGISVILNSQFLKENGLKLDRVLTDLTKLPQWVDKI